MRLDFSHCGQVRRMINLGRLNVNQPKMAFSNLLTYSDALLLARARMEDA